MIKYYNINVNYKKGKTLDMNDEFGQDIVSVTDEEGNEHFFEELDRIDTEDGNKYVALIPIYDEEEEILDADGDVLILKVIEENNETYLIQIEDEKEFNEVGTIIEDRLIEKYEKQDAAE